MIGVQPIDRARRRAQRDALPAKVIIFRDVARAGLRLGAGKVAHVVRRRDAEGVTVPQIPVIGSAGLRGLRQPGGPVAAVYSNVYVIGGDPAARVIGAPRHVHVAVAVGGRLDGHGGWGGVAQGGENARSRVAGAVSGDHIGVAAEGVAGVEGVDTAAVYAGFAVIVKARAAAGGGREGERVETGRLP